MKCLVALTAIENLLQLSDYRLLRWTEHSTRTAPRTTAGGTQTDEPKACLMIVEMLELLTLKDAQTDG